MVEALKNVTLIQLLGDQRRAGTGNSLFAMTQIDLAYHSNKIEGSTLTKEQVTYLFDKNEVVSDDNGSGLQPMDDFVVANNHFKAFNLMLDTLDQPLSADIIKSFHRVLFSGIRKLDDPNFTLGDWKTIPNFIQYANTELVETVSPDKVNQRLLDLLERYFEKDQSLLFTHTDFHYRFEAIHPFADGNGRVGRLILFRETLKNGLVPPIIPESFRRDYLKALAVYPEDDFVFYRVVCQSQDLYLKQIEYFFGGIPVGLEPPVKQFQKSKKAFREWLDKREQADLSPESNAN